MKKKIWGGLILAAAVIVSANYPAYASEENTVQTTEAEQTVLAYNRIVPGVSIGEVDVSGMTKKEAKAAVQAYMEQYTKKTVTLKIDGETAYTTAAELGYAWSNSDVLQQAMDIAKTGNVIDRFKERADIKQEPETLELETAVDEEKLAQTVADYCAPYNKPAKNASLVKKGSGFQITDSKEGLLVDNAATASLVKAKLEDWDGEAFTVEAVCVVDKPTVSKADCEKVSETPMATFSTQFGLGDVNYNRNKNIENGCNLLNGIVLAPGESLSVLDTVMPFTLENGYYEAGTFENGKVSTGIGGGICQVSTTLYNALLLAELQIDVRYNHSMTVNYVPLAADAAISEGYKDLQFTNSTDAPLYIEGITDLTTGTITFNLYGHDTRKPGRRVEYKSETISKTDPGYVETVDKTKPAGYKEVVTNGYTGYVAKLWKYVYEDGKQISKEEVNTSTYIATDTEVIVGPKKGTSKKSK